MNEKELISKLNSLKNIEPSAEWKTRSRDILLNQISHSEDVKINKFKIFMEILPRQLFEQIAQPAMAVVLISLFILGGGVFSLKAASKNTKPGDSLYIAKIISEKAQLALTFDKKEKVKLGVEFASNRTKEIKQLINESDNSGKDAKVEKLAEGFRKEINAVKTRIGEINTENSNANCDIPRDNEEDSQIFSANSEKSDKGIQISESAEEVEKEEISENNEIAAPAASNDNDIDALDAISTSTESNMDKAIGEAEKLFNDEDYEGAINKLTEINNIIDNLNKEDGSASTTGICSVEKNSECGCDE